MGNCDGCGMHQPTGQIIFDGEPGIDGLPRQMVYFVCDGCAPDDPGITRIEFRYDDSELEAMLA